MIRISIAIGIIATFLLALYLIFNKYFEGQTSDEKGKRTVKEIDKTLNKLEREGIEPSLSDYEANEIADSLYVAMNGGGTDWRETGRALSKMKNKADWYVVVDKFGLRENTHPFYKNYTGNLEMWIADEYSDNEKDLLQERYFDKIDILI